MKYFFSFCLLLCGLFSFQLNAQSPVKPIIIHHYFVEIDPIYRLDVRDIDDVVEDAENEMEGKDRITSIYIDTMFNIAIRELHTKLNYQIQDITALKGAIPFNAYEYPMASAKKAAKKLNGETYMRLKVNLGQPLAGGSESNTGVDNVFASQKRKFKPRIVIRAVLYDKNGKKIKDVKGVAKSKEKVILKAGSIGGIFSVGKKVTLDDNGTIIMSTYEKALEDLIKNLK